MNDAKRGSFSSFEPDRFLELSLLASFVIHGVAMLTMAGLLLPGMPGGTGGDGAARALYVATHPWFWRLGWLPWQLCAVSDLWLAIALLRVSWVPKALSFVVLALTICAVIPDQLAQISWLTEGARLAEEAVSQGDAAAYVLYEAKTLKLTAGWGALFYTISAVGWTACFAQAKTWSRTLSLLSVPLWGVMLVVTSAPLLPPEMQVSATFISVGNAIGFTLLQVWLALVTEEVLRRTRPFSPNGRLARFRHPSPGLLGRAVDIVANSRFLRALGEAMPVLAMRSDITDVVYVSYLVPAERLVKLVPKGLVLRRVGPKNDHAILTFLTYKHGHFGFAWMGPLRRLMPSPVHTNWRVHVEDPKAKTVGITFFTNAIASTALSLAARLLSEGMPMHVLRRGEVSRSEDGAIEVVLDAGEGSGPDARLSLRPSETPILSGAWKDCFSSFSDVLAYIVPQDRAMSVQPYYRRVTRQEIDLGIPLDACEPLTGSVTSRAAEALVGDAEPLCFRVAKVTFRFSEEAYSPWS